MLKWFCIFLAFTIFISSCVVRQPNANQVSFVSENNTGLIRVHAAGIGKNLPEIEQDAKTKVFESILFVGLPSSSTESYRLPMVENKAEMQNHPALKIFFNNKEYDQFITRVDRLEYLKQRVTGGGRVLNFNITVNHTALRRYMEQNQVIRKFGY